MKNFSTTFASNTVAILALGLPVLGFEVFDEQALTGAIAGFVGLGALLYNYYGRWRAGGISAFGIRKKKK